MQRLIFRTSSRISAVLEQGRACAHTSPAFGPGIAGPIGLRLARDHGRQTSGARRSVYTWKSTPPLTKIVATIGPVSEDFPTLQKVGDPAATRGRVC